MRLSFLLFIIISFHTFTKAQIYDQELESIMGIQIKKDLPKRFDISAEYQLRLDQHVTHIKGSYFYASIKYGFIKKYLYSEFEYRYSTSVIQDSHRFSVGLSGKYKYKKFTFSDRLLYEREHEYFNSSYESGHEPTDYLRNRIEAKWEFKKHWETYLSGEAFIKFSNEGNKIDELRTVAGLEWEFIKHHTIDLYYRFQPEINQSDLKMGHIIGIGYEWDMPKFKKK